MVELQQKKTLGIAIASLVLGCFFFLPLVGFLFGVAAITLGIIAAIKISKNQETLKGKGMAIAGIVLGGIGVVILPFIAILAAIAIPNLLRARMTANDALARATVQTITAAVETYATSNDGEYPYEESSLQGYFPDSMQEIDGIEAKGYVYSLDLYGTGYSLSAEPVECKTSGTKVYTMDSALSKVSESECQ